MVDMMIIIFIIIIMPQVKEEEYSDYSRYYDTHSIFSGQEKFINTIQGSPVKSEDIFKDARRAVKVELAIAQGKGVAEGKELTFVEYQQLFCN